MTSAASDASATGLLAEADDPARHLIGQFVTSPVVPLPKPDIEGQCVCGHLVASQNALIAHGPMLRASPHGIRLVLRRQRRGETEPAWSSGIDLALAIVDRLPGHVEMTALTQDAARALSARTGRTVSALTEARQTEANQAKAATLDWDPDHRTITQGKTSMAEDAIGWARLSQFGFVNVPEAATADCHDLAAAQRSALGKRPEVRGPLRLVVRVTNGVGLGHLTRLLAICDQLALAGPIEPVFWCYSRAAELITARGWPVVLRQTAAHLGADRPSWQRWEAADLAAHLRATPTDLVLHDGSGIGPGLAEAMRDPAAARTGLILIRRGHWRAGTDRTRLKSVQPCDAVITPGDVTAASDAGPTADPPPEDVGLAEHITTSPVLSTNRTGLMSRADARRHLGIQARAPVCLVSLGAEGATLFGADHQCIEETARVVGVELFWLCSPLSATPPGVGKAHRYYPIAPCFAAFDGIVCAAGYNTFHEALMLTDVPVLFLPRMEARLDDQGARAAYAAQHGWADHLTADNVMAARSQLQRFFGAVAKRPRVQRNLGPSDGASEIATHIRRIASRYRACP